MTPEDQHTQQAQTFQTIAQR